MMFQRPIIQKAVPAIYSALGCGLATIKGRATIQGTRDFVDKSSLNMSFRLNQSNLTINPIIHGAPRHFNVTEKDYFTTLATRAVLINRSNCLVVYDHRRGRPWALSGLDTIIDPDNKISRENIVAIAHLGLAVSNFELYGRLSDACKQSGLQQIDIAIFEVNDDILVNKPHKIQEAVLALSDLVKQGSLQSYGIKISVSPYMHHNPPIIRSYSHGNLFPTTIEDFMRTDTGTPNDLVLYNISPTTFQPATYPMLVSHESDSAEESNSENTRLFTRVSCDPLICLRGSGKVAKNEEEEIELSSQPEPEKPLVEEPIKYETELNLVSGLLDKQVEKVIGNALDELCPKLASTPRLQDKALRTVFSVGIDAMMIDAELSSLMGKNQLSPKDLLKPQDTEGVFGYFGMPEDLRNR